MRTGHHRFKYARAAVVVCAALAAGFSTAVPSSVASPAPDDPSLSEVRDRVGTLHHEAEQANERYLTLIDQVTSTKQKLKATRKDVRAQRGTFDKIKKRVTSTLVSDATDSPLGTTGELLSSEDPAAFIDGLGAMQAYNSTQSDMLAEYTKTADELSTREDQLEDQLASISTAKKKMADEKAEVDKKAGAAEDLLDRLEADQRERVLNNNSGHGDDPSRDEDRPSDDSGNSDSGNNDSGNNDSGNNDSGNNDSGSNNATGGAAKAIEFAKAQIGDPYVYGATGPDSWDCSGLTGAAWGEAGVSLPRSSSQQAGVGTSVSTSDMQPGDLVFYYSPISHVGIYLGNGQLIHAPNSGSSVEITGVDVMPVSTVRRVG